MLPPNHVFSTPKPYNSIKYPQEQRFLLEVSKSDHWVNSSELPGLSYSEFTSNHWAGHIPISYAGKSDYGFTFYWLFESPEEPEEKPIIIWLNGGPGCSSMDGVFIENGPFRIQEDGLTLKIEQHSWHHVGNMLYIDQPLGTGLSYVNPDCDWCTYVQNQTAINEQMYFFLQTFFQLYPEYLNGEGGTRDLYFSGESYAGHYIPAISDYIISKNNAITNGQTSTTDVIINLVGAAIGNGWSDPYIQYDYAEFANNIGIIRLEEREALEQIYGECQSQENKGDFTGEGPCNGLQLVLISSSYCSQKTYQAEGICDAPSLNYYDVRLYEKNPLTGWPFALNRSEVYLDNLNVRKAIHADTCPHTYTECSDAGKFLAPFDGIGAIPEIQRLLDEGIKILFYNGQYDLICTHQGTEKLLKTLKWKGSNSYQQSPGFVWLVNDSPAGYYKASEDNLLSFMVVIGGSHMVPMDKPQECFDMMQRFTTNKDFRDFEQPISVSVATNSESHELTVSYTQFWTLIIGTSFFSAFITVIIYKFIIKLNSNQEKYLSI